MWVEKTHSGCCFGWLLPVLLVASFLALSVAVLGMVSTASAPLWCAVCAWVFGDLSLYTEFARKLSEKFARLGLALFYLSILCFGRQVGWVGWGGLVPLQWWYS